MEPEGLAKERVPLLFVIGGAATAIVSIPLAAAAGPPYLSLDALSPWLITYAIGLFAALFATPFLLHARLDDTLESDARWERAVVLWGAIATGVLAASLLCGLPSGFGTDSLGGALSIVGMAEAVLVIATLVVWLISG